MVQTIEACQHGFNPRLEHRPKVKIYARVSSRVPFLHLKNKQPNLAFLSGRLTSSSDLALSRSFSVQRSFFRGDVISITSWAPDVDVVNRVRPSLVPSPPPQLLSLARGGRTRLTFTN